MTIQQQDNFEHLSVKSAEPEYPTGMNSTLSDSSLDVNAFAPDFISVISPQTQISSLTSNITVFTNATPLPIPHMMTVDVRPLSQLTNNFSLPQSLLEQLASGDVTEVRVLQFQSSPRPSRSVDPNVPPTRFIRRGTRGLSRS